MGSFKQLYSKIVVNEEVEKENGILSAFIVKSGDSVQPEDFIEDSDNLEEKDLEEAIDDAETKEMPGKELSDLFTHKIKMKDDPKYAKEYEKQRAIKKASVGNEQGIAGRLEKLLHNSTIKDENGNPITLEQTKKLITQRPKSLIGQNTKLGKSGNDQVFYDLTLPSYQGLFYDEHNSEFKIVKTCPRAGDCKMFCYAAKGGYIQFEPSALQSARTINFLMNDPGGFKTMLLKELSAALKSATKQGKQLILRWHDSGDFISESYMQLAFDIAKAIPQVEHYAYTKQVPLVRQMEKNKPTNFEFIFSFGGTEDATIDTTKEKHARVVKLEHVPEHLTKVYTFINDEEIVEFVNSVDGDKVFNKFNPVKALDKYKLSVSEAKKLGVDLIELSSDKSKLKNGLKKAFKLLQPGLDQDIEKLKVNVAQHFKLQPENVISYDEMMKIKPGMVRKWNVLVWKGHGDDAGLRRDVLGIYLIFH